ncbi:hypothetical protein BU26DRAFT_185908 [Trematosphaeria pertusa]|uniref:Uncharacterized protein n=1 Tax=Trematosphaeria pertusa TaxID=390896 RepID=A0A6A6HSY5_9PLEO|nr:uncharacterized protein BU26DRAFT_185908 [Trematosphaeria pertusa]KAF2241009.1 hypothetical protein BU26DRAFT_185908 [Trematosphaeria pertusa]
MAENKLSSESLLRDNDSPALALLLEATQPDGSNSDANHESDSTGKSKASADPTPSDQKAKAYKWLSKSSKRRIRKGMQKQKRTIQGDHGKERAPSSAESWLREMTFGRQRKDDEGMARWRRMKAGSDSSLLSECRGPLHQFACAHRFQVLCPSCADAWELGISRQCPHKLTETKEAKTNLCFERRCPGCKIQSWDQLFKELHELEPALDRPEDITWTLASFEPLYLAKGSLRSTIRSTRRREFYPVHRFLSVLWPLNRRVPPKDNGYVVLGRGQSQAGFDAAGFGSSGSF